VLAKHHQLAKRNQAIHEAEMRLFKASMKVRSTALLMIGRLMC
jgi:hypothetical protein